MQAKREQWSGFAKKTEASHLVFLDESGVNINMTRRYGRGKGGQRVVDHAPLNTPQSTTILSSIRLDGEMAYTTFQGGTTGDKFLTYLKDVLIPTRDRIKFPVFSIFQWNSHIHICNCAYGYSTGNFCKQGNLRSFLCD